MVDERRVRREEERQGGRKRRCWIATTANRRKCIAFVPVLSEQMEPTGTAVFFQ